MTTESTTHPAEQIRETLDHTGQIIREKSAIACDAMAKEASHLATCASERIRENPLPIVLGAVGVGIAIGALIMSGRQSHSYQEALIQEPLEHAGDAIRNSLGHFYNSVKFW
ncbi:hypothetical protein JIN84_14605 [Luteolibacter yonseiensis]|uniref:DUF883 domain-containing protein n=1 Tax=Luteolibacter yonseiensis TaxID=1144680 RepID=A0A934R6G5_9BACT|nr:hypothetical protein [Luteolibacter yonseiensis]MBK1816853.1 hypothetical protein [Luteolibacter yonseiensis]